MIRRHATDSTVLEVCEQIIHVPQQPPELPTRHDSSLSHCASSSSASPFRALVVTVPAMAMASVSVLPRPCANALVAELRKRKGECGTLAYRGLGGVSIGGGKASVLSWFGGRIHLSLTDYPSLADKSYHCRKVLTPRF